MIDEPAKLNRRRRRWIIAGVLLLLVIFTWRCWPRVDHRFAGAWQPTQANSFPFASVEFVADGTGFFASPPGTKRTFRWFTRGEVVTIITDRPGLDGSADLIKLVLFNLGLRPSPGARWLAEELRSDQISIAVISSASDRPAANAQRFVLRKQHAQ